MDNKAILLVLKPFALAAKEGRKMRAALKSTMPHVMLECDAYRWQASRHVSLADFEDALALYEKVEREFNEGNAHASEIVGSQK